jgi:hypothetical protein
MLVLVVLGAVPGSTVARASVVGHKPTRAARASQVVLGTSFQPLGVGAFFAGGDYLLVRTTTTNGFQNTDWMVINDRVGTTTALDAQCGVDALGPPWVLMSCDPTSNPSGPYDIELYSLADGTQQMVTPSPGVPYCSTRPPAAEGECAFADAVGADWIRWDATCYHCDVTTYFQNIETGEVRDDPTNATTFPDLNSPALAHGTCPGVRLVRENEGYSMPWGSLTSYGQFALAIGSDSRGFGAAYLERCGTRMRRLLASSDAAGAFSPLASNSNAIVWQAVSGQLNGLFLPSLQTFTIRLPSALVTTTGLSEIGLTSRGLYVRDWASGTLWRTASPTVLPLNMSRPGLTRSGRRLTCRRGGWHNAVDFSYAWRVNGAAKKDPKPRLTLGTARKPRSVSCSVTASNAAGTTTASSAQLHVR